MKESSVGVAAPSFRRDRDHGAPRSLAAGSGDRFTGLARVPLARSERSRAPLAPPVPPRAVLLDRDGTLVVDVPYNGDPSRVVVVPGARAALDRLRGAGLKLAVVTNQSGIGRGILRREDVDAVHRRVEELLGPLGRFYVCEHAPDQGCPCRKPRSGLLLEAARDLGVEPAACVVVGDIGSDVDAALAAGMRPILVPTPATRAEEVERAPEVALDLGDAVDRVLLCAPAEVTA